MADKTQLKKESIVKAARECFARYGYAKTTLEDIGKGARLNKATLYYYYKNKESIFTDVILLESEEHMASLQEKVAQTGDFSQKIILYLKERLDYYRHVVNLHQLSVQFLREVEPIFDQLYTKVLDQEVQFIAGILEEGTRQGIFSTSDHARIARSLLTMADTIKFKAVHQSGQPDAAAVDYAAISADIEFISRLVLEGLQR